MATKKKQEDKHLKILKELVTLPHNKKCFDCGQRGPTYVNMTVGAFVCTSCSGLLRGLNPPHRVKSISMATFNPQEIEFLQKHGNDVCHDTWLGLWDAPAVAEPDSKEEQKVKDFLCKKYERKTWYTNRPKIQVPSQDPEAKPLKTLLGENTPQVIVHPQKEFTNSFSPQISPPGLNTTVVAKPAQPVATHKENQSNMDLLGDLGPDPFGSSTSTNYQSNAFGTFQQPPPPQNQQQQHQQSGNAFGSSFEAFASSQPNQQSSGTLDFFGSTPMNVAQSSKSNDFFSTSSVSNPSTDKYAALADLEFNTSSTQSVFSGKSSIFGTPSANMSAMTNNTQPNPFMSPGTQSSGAAVFQQQQQKAANPFETPSMGVFNSQYGNVIQQPFTGQDLAPQQNVGNMFSNTTQSQSHAWQNTKVSSQGNENWANSGVNFSANSNASQFQNMTAFGTPPASFGGSQFQMQSNIPSTQSNNFGNSNFGHHQQPQQSGFGQVQQNFGNQSQPFGQPIQNQMFQQAFSAQQQFNMQQQNANFNPSYSNQLAQPVSKPPFGGVQIPGFGQSLANQQQSFGTWGNTQTSQPKSNNPFM